MEKTLEQLKIEKVNLESQIGRLSREKEDILHIMERTRARVEQLRKEEKKLTEAKARIKDEYEGTKARVDSEVIRLNSLKENVENKLRDWERKKQIGIEKEIQKGLGQTIQTFVNQLEFSKKQLTEETEKFQVKLHRITEKL